MLSHVSRPFRPIELSPGRLEFFDLRSLGKDLRSQPELESSGVSAVTLTRDEHVTLVLVALRRGSAMREHHAPSAGTMVVLGGRVAFVAGDGARTELGPGAMAAFSADVPHAVEALDDAEYLVVIGGRERGPVAS
jgi:quercetin dioxygenase-like cupin family protein